MKQHYEDDVAYIPTIHPKNKQSEKEQQQSFSHQMQTHIQRGRTNLRKESMKKFQF